MSNSFRYLIYKLHNFIIRSLKIRTFGVRALVIKEDKILLVTHTYVSNWYAIGGGVEKGETPQEAIERELFEEVGIKSSSPPELFGVYHNTISKPDDIVVLYLIKDFTQEEVKSSEILEAKWFPLTNIPKNTAIGTRRRIEEYLKTRPISDKW